MRVWRQRGGVKPGRNRRKTTAGIQARDKGIWAYFRVIGKQNGQDFMTPPGAKGEWDSGTAQEFWLGRLSGW